MSDGTVIHRLASACTPHARRGSQGTVSTSCVIFSYILSEDFTQKNFTHNQTAGVRTPAIDQSHGSSLQRLTSSNKAVQLLHGYLDVPHISKKGGAITQTNPSQRGIRGQADTVSTSC